MLQGFSSYEGFALLYASNETLKSQVTITTIDAKANDFPDREIRIFIWLKLYTAHSKDATVLYFGPRKPEGMEEFIIIHGTQKAIPKTSLRNLTDI